MCIRQTSIATTSKLLNPSTRSIFLAQVAAHHFTTGVVFIILGIIRFFTSQLSILTSYIDYHADLSINLATWASLSIIAAVILTATPVYPYLSTDYSTVLSMLETLDWYQISWNLVLPIHVMAQVEVVHVKYHLGITYSQLSFGCIILLV